MAALTIEVPDRIAEALEPLEGEQPLVADAVALKDVLRLNIHALHETLWEVSERADDPEPDDLRRLAGRLEVLASAVEASSDRETGFDDVMDQLERQIARAKGDRHEEEAS